MYYVSVLDVRYYCIQKNKSNVELIAINVKNGKICFFETSLCNNKIN